MADDGCVELAVCGEVDPETASLLESALEGVSPSAARIAVDLSAVTFMDSTGLKVLLDAYRNGRQGQEALVLRSPTPMIRQLLNITGLDELIPIESADAATTELIR